jgi:acyl-CoA thioester hydrolase
MADAHELPSAIPGPVPLSFSHTVQFRVRYSETDQMGTIYNSRPLEWFEVGRTELLRTIGLPYTEMETRDAFLPLVESHVEYLGRARYDDLLEMTTSMKLEGRARLRSEVMIRFAADGRPVARGHTVHAFTNAAGKAIRPPKWFLARLGVD